MEVLQSLHHSWCALHISVVDHDITCARTQSKQIIKYIQIINYIIHKLFKSAINLKGWQFTIYDKMMKPISLYAMITMNYYIKYIYWVGSWFYQCGFLKTFAHQTPLMGWAAPAVFLHVWSHMWQSHHQNFSCLRAKTHSKHYRDFSSSPRKTKHMLTCLMAVPRWLHQRVFVRECVLW